MRTYIVSHKGVLIGNFSNRKILYEAICKVESRYEELYIIGERKHKSFDTTTLGNSFRNKYLELYLDDSLTYKIWEITLNSINPKYGGSEIE